MLKMHRNLPSQASVGNIRRYEDAINLLNSRRRDVRPKLLPELADDGLESLPSKPTFTGKPSLSGMRTWLNSLGHSDNDIAKLNVIHIAGTKGKGSTCAFTSSFLHAHGDRTGYPRKIGLYTSPHLKRVQERIQINRKPISEELFTKYVFELLMLVAVHTFIKEKVDAAIYETHNGGEYDATNIFVEPVVTGISTIGMDHVEQLGPTIENIAWHKAGIFKSGRPAFSSPQEPLAGAMLDRRASEKNVALQYVEALDPLLPANASNLGPRVQRMNASLALALTRAFLHDKAPALDHELTQQDISMGVQQFFWIGRFQQVAQGRHQWFLDGAHNELSVRNAAEWFADMTVQNQSVSGSNPHILIFSHISDRDGATLLSTIASTLQERRTTIQYLIISTYEQRLDGVHDTDRCFQQGNQPFPADMQEKYVDAWRSIFPQTPTAFESTVEGALNLARSLDQGLGMQTLITGSLYLVGGALRILEPHV